MKRAYLFVYNPALGTREEMKAHLNSISEVLRWRYDIDNCFYIVSDKSARQLADAIGQRAGYKARFIVSEYSDNSQGWLTEESWYLLNNKEYMPKK